jgi:hypothetical protein
MAHPLARHWQERQDDCAQLQAWPRSGSRAACRSPVHARPQEGGRASWDVLHSSPLASLRTLTPTVTGTGVTTTSGPGMPGAPGPAIRPPKVGQPINFNTADPNDVVTAEQAPEYAAINSAEHQDQLMGAAQLQAIQSGAMGLSAFIKKEGGTLGQDYVAALALQSGRNNTYQQYLTAQKYVDARLEVAAKAPTLYWELGQSDRDVAKSWREQHPYPPGMCESCGQGPAITKGPPQSSRSVRPALRR